MDVAIALSVLAVLAVANCLATRVVVRDSYTERRQKVFQLLAVWLVPVFGAILFSRCTGNRNNRLANTENHETHPWTTSRLLGTLAGLSTRMQTTNHDI